MPSDLHEAGHTAAAAVAAAHSGRFVNDRVDDDDM